MTIIKAAEFKNNRKQLLRGFVHVPEKYRAAVIFLHGFPGHCSGSTAIFSQLAAEKFGYLAMRFDFSGTDTSKGDFSEKRMSQEVKDIKYAIDFLEDNYPFRKLVLVGHSTGAIDAALYAHQDERINKLVLLGAVSRLDEAVHYDFSDRQVREFWTKGFITYKNKEQGADWWCHNKKLKKQFYDEFFTLDIPKAIQKWTKPLLIIHGEKDEAIPVRKDPHELFAMANKPKRLLVIKGANHKFSEPVHTMKVMQAIDKFIKE